MSNNSYKIFKTNTIVLELNSSNGVNDVRQHILSNVYPNPFKQKVNFSIPVESNGLVSIVIADLSGKIISQFKKRLEHGIYQFSFTSKKSGIYILKCSVNSLVYNAKLICTEGSFNNELNYSGDYLTDVVVRSDMKAIIANPSKDFKVSSGDKLEFTGYSNSRVKILTDSLHFDKGYTFKFIDNIWEVLSKNQDLDSVRNYLYSFDNLVLDEAKSTLIDIDELGQNIYSNIVRYNDNIMFSRLAALNNDDSSYVALLPNNNAWIKSYDNIKNYYRYYYNPSIPNEENNAYLLQKNSTAFSILKDMFYSKSMQVSPSDSMVSTNLGVIYQTDYLFNGLTKETASNGEYYIADELKFKDSESWNKEIRIEAERSKGRSSTYSNIFDRTYSGLVFGDISKRGYIEVNATNIINPTVSFAIPNVLSGKLNGDNTIEYGASYNIYCVFVPEVIRTFLAKAKANKVYFELSYTDENMQIKTIKYDNNGDNFVSDKLNLSKILVAENVTFPYSESGIENSKVTIKVKSSVKNYETIEFTKDLLIDCIILEPVR